MSTIRAIVAQLHSRSDTDRREALRSISGLFLERPDDHGDRESEIFGHVFIELLESLPQDDRIDFADRFAEVAQTPVEVVRRLAADDDVRVAGPMLEHATTLSDETLTELAGRQSRDHLLAIARRRRLAAPLTDVLVERGDAAVLETVSRNTGAAFSDEGLAQLTRSALDAAPIAEALFRRLDISLDRFGGILARVDESASERLGHLLVTNRAAATALLTGSLEETSARRERERAETEAMIALVRSRARRLDGCLDDLLRDDRVEDIARLLAAFAELDATHVATVLVSRNDFGLALVCRCVQVGEPTWIALDRLRRRTSGSPEVSAADALLAYREVDKASADRALRFHRVRSQLT